jgi:hypothetical protein
MKHNNYNGKIVLTKILNQCVVQLFCKIVKVR